MKYSIKGQTFVSDGSSIISIVNKYKVWKLEQSIIEDIISKTDIFVFEVWVDTVDERNNLFDDLKQIINNNGGFINWHKCYHDEKLRTSCIIEEEYRGA